MTCAGLLTRAGKRLRCGADHHACYGMHDFKRLRVWQEGRLLSADLHAVARRFPKCDRQIIASQLRRSASGVPSAIAEGCGKDSRAETLRYLQIAAGSASETEHHIISAGDLDYISAVECTLLAERASRLHRMIRALCRNFPR